MFVTISLYHAKAGEEDAVIALHEEWQRNLRSKVKGNLSGELLRNIDASREFIAIMRYENQESEQILASDPDHGVWYQRLISLTDGPPSHAKYQKEWEVR